MAFVDLTRVRPGPGPEVVSLVAKETARELRALPVKRDGNTLWVALDSLDLSPVEPIKNLTGLRVIPVLCASSALDGTLERLEWPP